MADRVNKVQLALVEESHYHTIHMLMNPITTALLLLSGLAVAPAFSVQASSASDTVLVETGLLIGKTNAGSGVVIYEGIPFAAPPVGDRRWRPPVLPATWSGVKHADEFKPSCIQNLAGSRPPWTEEFMVQNEISEDCLYLNVWTPAGVPATAQALPVLVFVHGGGFVEGSGSVAVYDGANLARKGLVVVTINYRLGTLGFFAHPELTAESEQNASGNYGLLDQIAALEWIRKNIAAFGGDPQRVTVAGQSAGAMSVSLLLMSPLSEGLFHRAIIQSGPGGLASYGILSDRTLARDLSEAEADGLRFAANKSAASLGELRNLSADDLMKPVGDGPPLRFGPVVDGLVLVRGTDGAGAEARRMDVPTLSGMNADENSAFPGYGEIDPATFTEQAEARYGSRADTFLKLYPPGSSAEEAGRSQVQSTRDLGLAALRRVADVRNETVAAPQYLYYFDRAIPWPEHPNFGVFHSSEIPYVFDNLEMLPRPWEEVDRAIAETMSSYWVNFITSGTPHGAGLPHWPPYDASDPQIMMLGAEIRAREMPQKDRAVFFEQYLSDQLGRTSSGD